MGEPRSRISKRWLTGGFLAYFSLRALLLPQAIKWDGIGFLLQTEHYYFGDVAHILYASLLRTTILGTAPLGIPPEIAGKLLSAACGAGVFVFLARLLTRFSKAPGTSVLISALFSTSPVFFQEAATIEVYAPALLFLLLAANAAAEFRFAGRLRALPLVALGLLLATTMHFTAILTTPGMIALGLRRAPQRKALLIGGFAIFAFALLSSYLLMSPPAFLDRFLSRIDSFLPRPESLEEGTFRLQANLRNLGRLFSEGAPFLSLGVSFGALIALAWREEPRRWLWIPGAVALSNLTIFAYAGTSFLGLLLPPLCFASFALAAGIETLTHRPGRWRLPSNLVLIALLGAQLALQIPPAFRGARTPDPHRQAASLIQEEIPPRAAVLAGREALHLIYFTSVPTTALPELLHWSRAADKDLRDAILNEAERWLATEEIDAVYLTGNARDSLAQNWQVEPETLSLATPILLEPDPGSDLDPVRLFPILSGRDSSVDTKEDREE